MGEAKQKKAIRERRINLAKPVPRERFELYAIGTREPMARIMAEELSYWGDQSEQVIGHVFRDTTDNDFGWILLARDRIGRFRCVDLAVSLRSEAYAAFGLRERIGRAIEEEDLRALGHQDDETNYAVDLLNVEPGTDPETLHPFFRILLETEARAPARAVLREIGPWLAPTDPHFVSEFQRKQFDQRLWELYLWACLRELDFKIRQPEAPDFLCSYPGVEFSIEATTTSPSLSGPLVEHPDPKTPEELREFLQGYMAIKFGSSLTSKLNKRTKTGENYWERGAAAGKPFVLAVADFHRSGKDGEIGSMTYTQSAIWPYLYGHRVEWETVDGELTVQAVKNPFHAYKDKVIPSGFFDLPGAENVSAVLFSNAGTIAKFDRMGVMAGFRPADHTYRRIGLRYNPDPNAVLGEPFSQVVGEPGYSENWTDELQIFHNPNARSPLPDWVFGPVMQHFFRDGDYLMRGPANSVIASHTIILAPRKDGPNSDVDATAPGAA